MADLRPNSEKHILDEPPPVLRTWPRVYVFILLYFALVVVLLWIFTRSYAP